MPLGGYPEIVQESIIKKVADMAYSRLVWVTFYSQRLLFNIEQLALIAEKDAFSSVSSFPSAVYCISRRKSCNSSVVVLIRVFSRNFPHYHQLQTFPITIIDCMKNRFFEWKFEESRNCLCLILIWTIQNL